MPLFFEACEASPCPWDAPFHEWEYSYSYLAVVVDPHVDQVHLQHWLQVYAQCEAPLVKGECLLQAEYRYKFENDCLLSVNYQKSKGKRSGMSKIACSSPMMDPNSKHRNQKLKIDHGRNGTPCCFSNLDAPLVIATRRDAVTSPELS